MMKAARLLGLGPLLFLGACVLYQSSGDEVEPGCGAKGQSPDGAGCTCTSDCATAAQGTVCLNEFTTGVPQGLCAHDCAEDSDCNPGYLCTEGVCGPRCATSEECGVGRSCDDLPNDVRACTFLCDEDSDCSVGVCNLYSSRCVRGDLPSGGGVAAACTESSQCKSGVCLSGACFARCDASAQRCPDSATCVEGLCLVPCATSADCEGLGTPSCEDVGIGKVCWLA